MTSNCGAASPSQGRWDPDSLRPALRLGGQASACEGSPGCFRHVRLCVTPDTAAYQAPLSMGFSRQEHWSGLPLHCLLQCIRVKSESEVAQSCPTLCNPMNLSMPGLPVHHQLPEFTQTHVHQVGDAIQPSHPLSSQEHWSGLPFPSPMHENEK